METLDQLQARLAQETVAAYLANPFSLLSRDYFARFWRDAAVTAGPQDTQIGPDWAIVHESNEVAGATQLAALMAGHLRQFLVQAMGLNLPVRTAPGGQWPAACCIVLAGSGGGDPAVPESFTITAEPQRIVLAGRDAAGLRDAVVKLVELIGLRRAPVVARGSQTYRPRLPVRLGALPYQGQLRDLVFLGYNALYVHDLNCLLFELSTSKAIPELIARQQPQRLTKLAQQVQEARQYDLTCLLWVCTVKKFDGDDPVFQAHPEIRGAKTWKENGQYVLCTEHPLVQQYLCESIQGIFRAAPQLGGVQIIIGGEGFYHCFMRPFGVAKGHSNCPRCAALGPETVVANLCNRLAAAARSVNPQAQIVAWPYSAAHIWSRDDAELPFIAKLGPGTALFTEIEKDEYVTTPPPQNVRKHLWDYSVHLIGPGVRAAKQIAAGGQAGIPVYLKSEPELAFEAPRLAHLPCLDRWLARAHALAGCGAAGAFVFPAFRPHYLSSASECYKLAWWNPCLPSEQALGQLAARLAGPAAGPLLSAAWGHASQALEFSPELPSYYTGPYYLGPAHPMCADPQATLPEVFYGRMLFMAEIDDSEGLKLRPTFFTSPRGNVPLLGQCYRRMEQCLAQAHQALEAAGPLVDAHCRLTFTAEANNVGWFYRTCRSHANFYESCLLRDQLQQLRAQKAGPRLGAEELYRRWQEVLADEYANTQAALPIALADQRLDFYYGSDHSFAHNTQMLQAKLAILQQEREQYLPGLWRELTGVAEKVR